MEGFVLIFFACFLFYFWEKGVKDHEVGIGEVERIREELKEGEKHDQNILYDNFFKKKYRLKISLK